MSQEFLTDSHSTILFDMNSIPLEEKPHVLELAQKVNATIVQTHMLTRQMSYVMGQTNDEQIRSERFWKYFQKYLPFMDKLPVIAIGTSFILFCITMSAKAMGFPTEGVSKFFHNFLHAIGAS
jgi:hypothetical protein